MLRASKLLILNQTAAGKTHTLWGDLQSDINKGISPRIVDEIFQTIAESTSDLEFTVKSSMFEIYMERVRDLLNSTSENLSVHEDKISGVYVKNLTHVYCGNANEVFQIMQRGQISRATSFTEMNSESSRSHALFVLEIAQTNLKDGSRRVSKLSLVDLAGSERIGKTGATGQTLEEGKKINLSLSCLGKVINSLTDGKSSHIPYRDSKLTRILQESIGGNSKTTLIINCSSALSNESETISTLRFGVRAKFIKNTARVNIELSAKELLGLLKASKLYITKLEGEINDLKNVHNEFDLKSESVPLSLLDMGFEVDEGFVAENGDYLNGKNEVAESHRHEIFESERLLSNIRDELKAERIFFGRTNDENKKLHTDIISMKVQSETGVASLRKAENIVVKLNIENAEFKLQNRIFREEIADLKEAVVKQKAEIIRYEKTMVSMVPYKVISGAIEEKEREIKLSSENLDQLAIQDIELYSLQTTLDHQESKIQTLEEVRVAMDMQLADVHIIKNNLLVELKERCERVVELEMALQQSNEKIKMIGVTTNTAFSAKMNMLEKTLVEVDKVQKRLIEQNSALKKDKDLSERRLEAKNERLVRIESHMIDLQVGLVKKEVEYESALKQLNKKVLSQGMASFNISWSIYNGI